MNWIYFSEMYRNRQPAPWRGRALTTIGIAIAISLFATLPANSAPQESDRLGLTQLELENYAKEAGLPLENAARTLADQEIFAEMVATWSDDSAFVDAEWRGQLGGRITIKTALEQKIHDSSARVTFPVMVEIDRNERMSNKERERATEGVARQLTKMKVDEYALGIDPLSNVLTLTVPERQGHSVDELKALASDAALSAAGKPLEVVVEVTPSHPEPAHRGGQPYLLGTNPANYCTGGFTVTRSSVLGVSTAAHCSPKPSYYDGAAVGETVGGSDRDVRWTRVYGTSSAQFQYTANGYYTANTSRNPTIGEAVGRYGRTTGANSGTVRLSGQCLKYTGWPEYCGLFATGTKTLIAGDSGGPWYLRAPGPVTVALGISSGTYSGRDYFSGVGSLNLLNMVVVTA